MLPTAAISVLVLIAAGESSDASARTMEQALHAALGADAQIVVRKTSEPMTDDRLREAADADETTLVSAVVWSDHDRRARIHSLSPRDGQSFDREIRFDPRDAAAERGRTIGFALASMVPPEAMTARETTPPEPLRPAVVVAPLAPGPDVGLRARDAVEPRRFGAPRLAVDASAAMATALAGYGGGLGAVVGVRLRLGGALEGRIAVGARTGEIGPAQATTRILSGALGIAWQPWLDGQRRWAAGARIDALLLHERVSHFSEDDPEPVLQATVVPAVDVALEGTYRFAESAGLVVAVGTEAALGQVSVVVHGREAAVIASVRPFAESGIRLFF